MVWITLAAVAVILFLDWALAAACTRHERRRNYEDLDEPDGTHEVTFDADDHPG